MGGSFHLVAGRCQRGREIKITCTGAGFVPHAEIKNNFLTRGRKSWGAGTWEDIAEGDEEGEPVERPRDLEGRNRGGVGLLSTTMARGGGYGRWWWPATMGGAAGDELVEQLRSGPADARRQGVAAILIGATDEGWTSCPR